MHTRIFVYIYMCTHPCTCMKRGVYMWMICSHGGSAKREHSHTQAVFHFSMTMIKVPETIAMIKSTRVQQNKIHKKGTNNQQLALTVNANAAELTNPNGKGPTRAQTSAPPVRKRIQKYCNTWNSKKSKKCKTVQTYTKTTWNIFSIYLVPSFVSFNHLG